MSGLCRQLPLLGLVLFGDPQLARRFYRENFAVAMDRRATTLRNSTAIVPWP